MASTPCSSISGRPKDSMAGATGILVVDDRRDQAVVPEKLKTYFESVTKIDTVEAKGGGGSTRRIDIYLCRGYRGHPNWGSKAMNVDLTRLSDVGSARGRSPAPEWSVSSPTERAASRAGGLRRSCPGAVDRGTDLQRGGKRRSRSSRRSPRHSKGSSGRSSSSTTIHRTARPMQSAHCSRDEPRVRCLQRIGRRGLSSACVEGMLASSAPYLAVMDADLQHDERILPQDARTAALGRGRSRHRQPLRGGRQQRQISRTTARGSARSPPAWHSQQPKCPSPIR